MIRIPIEIPSELNCEVVGCLLGSDNSQDLGQDMVEVTLPNGIAITAGWFPEMDPNGKYIVSISRDSVEIAPAIEAKDIYEAAKEIEMLTELYKPATHHAGGMSLDNPPAAGR